VILFFILLIVSILLILICLITVKLEIKITVREGINGSFLVIRTLSGSVHIEYRKELQLKNIRLYSIEKRKTYSLKKSHVLDKGLFELVKRRFRSFHDNNNYLKYIKDKIKVRDFSLVAQIGTGDAAHTALLTAGLYSLSSIILCHLKNIYNLENQSIIVVPVFDKEIFELEANCIIVFKLGHIIIVGIQKIAEKIKGGERIARASN